MRKEIEELVMFHSCLIGMAMRKILIDVEDFLQ